MSKVTIRQTGSLDKVMKSDELGDQLWAISEPAWDAVNRDPSEAYVASLQRRRYITGGREGRVSVQIGAHPVIGTRVEAKRGTMQRALGEAGLT